MDPTTAIASIHLASKLLPQAAHAVGKVFGPDNGSQEVGKAGKILPAEAVSFDKLLEAQRLPSKSVQPTTISDRVGRYLSTLPELQANQAEWSSLTFEIHENGELTLIRADQSRQFVPLSAESKSVLRELYQQSREASPPLTLAPGGLKLEIGPQRSPVGLPSAGRMLIWKAV